MQSLLIVSRISQDGMCLQKGNDINEYCDNKNLSMDFTASNVRTKKSLIPIQYRIYKRTKHKEDSEKKPLMKAKSFKTTKGEDLNYLMEKVNALTKNKILRKPKCSLYESLHRIKSNSKISEAIFKTIEKTSGWSQCIQQRPDTSYVKYKRRRASES